MISSSTVLIPDISIYPCTRNWPDQNHMDLEKKQNMKKGLLPHVATSFELISFNNGDILFSFKPKESFV